MAALEYWPGQPAAFAFRPGATGQSDWNEEGKSFKVRQQSSLNSDL